MISQTSLIFIVLILLFTSNCGDDKTNNIEMMANKEIESINDSIFFARIEAIRIYKNNIYFSDYNINKIYKLDNDFHLLNSLGKYGNGPKEFNGLQKFEIVKDTIIAYQSSGRKIKLFSTNGEYLSGFTSPVGSIFNRFAVDSSLNIYISTPRRKYPISVISKNGIVINEFGKWFLPKKSWQKSERNFRNLKIDSDGNLICVYMTEPIIEKYSLDGQLLSSIDLRNNYYLNKRVNYIEKKYSNEKQNEMVGHMYALFSRIDIKDKYLYLLYLDKMSKNILVVENNMDKLVFRKNIILKGKVNSISYIKSFCVKSKNEIIGFDGKIGHFINFKR